MAMNGSEYATGLEACQRERNLQCWRGARDPYSVAASPAQAAAGSFASA